MNVVCGCRRGEVVACVDRVAGEVVREVFVDR